MFSRRSLSVFAAAFGMVLITGIAAAQVGPFAPDEPVNDAPTTTQVDEAPDITEPAPDTEREPEPVVEEAPKDDEDTAAEEPKDEPVTEEPKGDEGTHEEEAGAEEEAPPADVTPPAFEILHPTDGQHFETKEVVFEGHVEPGARVFAGEWEADVNEDGAWRIVLLLNPGQNVATLKAVDEAGNTSTDTVTVHYDKPVEEPKEPVDEGGDKPKEGEEPPKEGEGGEQPAEVAFTANQQYGSCSEPTPYDFFWGTGTPGTTVWVGSPYGGGTTTVNGDGQWEIKVEFPEAPFDKTFEVVIEAEGGRKVFTFVRTGDGGEH